MAEKRVLNEEEITQLIEYLTGTCKSLDEACNDLFEEDSNILSDDDHKAIDDEIFRCETCDWWSPVDEEDEEGNCLDCKPEDSEEEED